MLNKFFTDTKCQSSKLNRIIVFVVMILFICTNQIVKFDLQVCFADKLSEGVSSAVANKIAPIVNESTFIVVHINLKDINLKTIREQFNKVSKRIVETEGFDDKLKKNTLNESQKLLDELFPLVDKVIFDLTTNAGLSELYLVGNLINSDDEKEDKKLYPIFFLAVPYDTKDMSDKNIIVRQKIERIFRFVSKSVVELREVNLLTKGNLLLYPLMSTDDNSDDSTGLIKSKPNLNGIIEEIEADISNDDNENPTEKPRQIVSEEKLKKYIDKFSATKNPYLEDAFKNCEGDLIKIIFLFSNPVKTFLTQISSLDFSDIQVVNMSRYIINQIDYSSIGIDVNKFRLQVIAKAKSVAAAKRVQGGLSGLIDLGITYVNTTTGVAFAVGGVGVSDKIFPLITLTLEIIRGTANFAIPNCDKDKLTWNYEINPEKMSPDVLAATVIVSCFVGIVLENYGEKLLDKWQKEIRPFLLLK
ncbi:MAG: hypothetical protein LBB88_00350 [Planctomycetaceae bacterium]|jgi:hypothetical protein|nr:hypothetical protein [Planctomycetaceae bacterium]